MAAAWAPVQAEPVADFYAAKTISVLIGFSPGGGYDSYGRLIARHMGRHIPGNPKLVAQNMPGAGSLKAVNNQFKHNENAVFRVRVRDITGKPLDDKGIKGVVVELSDGQKLPMRYGGHPPRDSVDYFWSIGWVIRADYPLGTLRYKIAATDLAGRVQTWESFGDPRSQIVIMPGDVEYSGTPQAPR